MHGGRSHTLSKITALICIILGVGLVGGGSWLAILGGSAFYVPCGLGIVGTGVLLWYQRREALWLYAAVAAGTLLWSVAEAGFDFWALAPRGDVVLPLGVWLLLPFVGRGVYPVSFWNRVPLLVVILAGLGVYGYALTQDPQDMAGVLPRAQTAYSGMRLPGDAAAVPAQDWPAYGRTQAGDRYSPLSQITAQNVNRLQVAWTFRTHDLRGPDDPVEITDEATPIKIGDMVYVCSPHQIVFALDAATGRQVWRFDPHLLVNPTFQHLTCRGVSYAATPVPPATVEAGGQGGAVAPQACAERIFLPTNDGRLMALDAQTGQLCPAFGNKGVIDLTEGMPMRVLGFYEPTSPPRCYGPTGHYFWRGYGQLFHA